MSATSLAAQTVIAATRQLLMREKVPVLIALDGPSGSGKSSVARLVASAMHATVVPADDFFAAEITDAEWEARTASERAADAVDWRRLRREALQPLLEGEAARWHAFDFYAGVRADGTYAMRTDFVERQPAPVIILDGAYSARPELADIIDLSVFVGAPPALREQRLSRREAANFLKAWHARWDPAEEYYFSEVRPPETFDVVVSTAPATHAG